VKRKTQRDDWRGGISLGVANRSDGAHRLTRLARQQRKTWHLLQTVGGA